MTERLAKFIADCGVASRRGAEDLIKSGAVSVNGVVVDTPVVFVDENDDVRVNGKKYKNNVTLNYICFINPSIL